MKIRIRYGELMTKGKNRKQFVAKLNNHIKKKLKELATFEFYHDLAYVNFAEKDLELVKRLIDEIPGIHSYSVVYKTTDNLDDIIELSAKLINDLNLDDNTTFKIETKRSNKLYPLSSPDITKKVAPLILSMIKSKIIVDVKNPKVILNIEIRSDGGYVYVNSYLGLGGFPYSMTGKALVLMSGGIDSPVASFLAMKQGIALELFHFESSPMTPIEAVQKVIDLSKELARFTNKEEIKLHLVPFTKIHQAILNNVSDSYTITIMRRMMVRLADMFVSNNNFLGIVTGEALGQVASQTMESLHTIEDASSSLFIRPLITYDKEKVIKIAKDINTYNISIRKFNDCCSIYVPKQPIIKPTVKRSLKEESKFEYLSLLEDSYQNIKTLIINKDSKLDITNLGFDLKDAINNMENNND